MKNNQNINRLKFTEKTNDNPSLQINNNCKQVIK